MKNWQKEIELQCSKVCSLNLLAWREGDNDKSSQVCIQVLGETKMVLIIENIPDSNTGIHYTVTKHTKNKDGEIIIATSHYEKLEGVRTYLDLVSMYLVDISYFL
jgi:hypothetical protein